jgi:DNA processing protein
MEMRSLTPVNDDYPYWLRSISDRPAVLHVRGQLLPGRRYVACVGTRQPSMFGQAVAREISGFLAAHGWSVVSGLALGVDTLCHEAALKAGGHTVAVLANGLDSVYPAQNRGLAERILSAGGALLSEQPLGTPALPQHLVTRDRLQSGMSAVTIVMQTDLIGGTMHTVRYAVLQDRPLIAPVPQETHVDEPKSRGILALTQRTGVDLARLVGASGAYAKHLTKKFMDRPVALPFADRDGYAPLLDMLERTAVESTARRALPQQLGLWDT